MRWRGGSCMPLGPRPPVDVESGMAVDCVLGIAKHDPGIGLPFKASIIDALHLTVMGLVVDADDVIRLGLGSVVKPDVEGGRRLGRDGREIVLEDGGIDNPMRRIIASACDVGVSSAAEPCQPDPFLRRIGARPVGQPQHLLLVAVGVQTVAGLVKRPFNRGGCLTNNRGLLRGLGNAYVGGGWIGFSRPVITCQAHRRCRPLTRQAAEENKCNSHTPVRI